MDQGFASPLLLIGLGALLLAAGIEDARTREIANAKNLAIALLAPAWWWASGLPLWPDAAIQIGVALAAFALFAAAFAAGWMGGGDVKMIGALALWLPPAALAAMLMTMSIAGGAVTLAMMAERRWRLAGGPAAEAAAPVEVPYGVAIAIAGLLALREPLLNHWS